MTAARQWRGSVPEAKSSRANSRNSLPDMRHTLVVAHQDVLADLRLEFRHHPPDHFCFSLVRRVKRTAAVGVDGKARLVTHLVTVVELDVNTVQFGKVV